MKLEDQVCTPDQGEKLKELGIKQESLYYWTHSKWGIIPYASVDFSGDPTSVFTVAELGLMLPDLLVNNHRQYELVCVKEDDCWLCRYVRDNNILDVHPNVIGYAAEAEATCRAGILIHLIEKQIVSISEINKKLSC